MSIHALRFNYGCIWNDLLTLERDSCLGYVSYVILRKIFVICRIGSLECPIASQYSVGKRKRTTPKWDAFFFNG